MLKTTLVVLFLVLNLFSHAQADVEESSSKHHFQLYGNYGTPQRLFDACHGLLLTLGYSSGRRVEECGPAPSAYNPNSFNHQSSGSYFDWSRPSENIFWYINIWACENNEFVRYFPDTRECSLITNLGAVPSDPKDNGNSCSQPTCGNPIKMGTGAKVQRETDYVDEGPGGLSIVRTYNGGAYGIVAATTVEFGKLWSYTSYGRLIGSTGRPKNSCYKRTDTGRIYCYSVPVDAIDATMSAVRPDGKVLLFTKNAANLWIADPDVSETLTPEYASDGVTVAAWTLNTPAGAIERYDQRGLLLSINRPFGGTQRFSYSNGTTNDSSVSRVPADAPVCDVVGSGPVAGADRILCVTDDWGRQLNFEYDARGNVAAIISPNGERYEYKYDGVTGRCTEGNGALFCSGNLTSVIFPDGKTRFYHYTEDELTSFGTCPSYGRLYNALTGITDENGARFASWGYQCDGSAITSEHAGGVEKVAISYGWLNAEGARNVAVTSFGGTALAPAKTVRNYHYILVQGVAKNDAVDLQCDGCGDFAVRTYDTRGNVASAKDWNGKTTDFTYEASRNLEIRRVEAAGTTSARTFSTVWHPDFMQPYQAWGPKRVTRYTYDDRGRTLTRTEQATSDLTGTQGASATVTGLPRRWTYAYNGSGQIVSITGPRTDIADITEYSYDSAGNLASIVNPLGQATRLDSYDRNGRTGRVLAANGVTTELTYWPRGWLKRRSVTAGGVSETTDYEYDGVGQLKLVTLPDHSTIRYDYDSAHRLTGVTDSLGNKLLYAYDLASNRIGEQVSDPANVLTRKIARVYDGLNRLKQQTGGAQ